MEERNMTSNLSPLHLSKSPVQDSRNKNPGEEVLWQRYHLEFGESEK